MKDRLFTKTGHKMSIKIWHNGPTNVLAHKAQHCDRDTATVSENGCKNSET